MQDPRYGLGADDRESRRAARRAVDFRCELVAGNGAIESRCVDVSPYGMWVDTTEPVAIDDTVVVSFVPPKRKRELTLFARVRRIDPSGDVTSVGLEFESLEWFEQKTLADCLRGIPPRLPGRA